MGAGRWAASFSRAAAAQRTSRHLFSYDGVMFFLLISSRRRRSAPPLFILTSLFFLTSLFLILTFK